MQRFVLQENINHFKRRLDEETDTKKAFWLSTMPSAMRRELAQLNSKEVGPLGEHVPRCSDFRYTPSEPEARRIFQRAFEESGQAYLILDLRPGLHIVDMTDAYAAATMTKGSDIAGRPLFEVFPDNPNDIAADGVANLFDSL